MYRISLFLVVTIVAFDIQRSFSFPNGTTDSGACEGYDGVLRLRSGDADAGSGTAFFLYAINQLIYADMYNLLPWIHFDYYGKVYDPVQHPFSMTSFKMMDGGVISIHDDGYPYPSAPILNSSSMHENTFIIKGSGIWNDYFSPVNKFHLHDPSCTSKPLIAFTPRQLMPGIHYNAPWAVRAWQYSHGDKHWQHMDPLNGPTQGQSIHNWFGAMRVRAASVVKKNFKLQPWLQEKVDETNPVKPGDPPCLAVHIRWSDKNMVLRTKTPLDNFLPYILAYIEEGGKSIFIATDETTVFDIIDKKWPSSVTSIIRKQQGTFLSKGASAVADQVDHHRSNTEALTEIYAMSKCSLLLHGYSAMTEAAIYLNVALHDHSINIDDPDHPNVDVFRTVVKGKLVQAQAL